MLTLSLPGLSAEQISFVTDIRANAAARLDLAGAQSLADRIAAFLNLRGAFENAEFHFFPHSFAYSADAYGDTEVTRIEAIARTSSDIDADTVCISLDPRGGAVVSAHSADGRTVELVTRCSNYEFDGLICVVENGCDLAADYLSVEGR